MTEKKIRHETGWSPSGWLAAVVVLPALAVLPVAHGADTQGTGGEVLYVLYREPKQALISLLGWALLCVWAWRHRRIDSRAYWRAAKSLPTMLFLALLAWMSITRLWSTVPANHLLEMRGWLLTFLLAVAIVAGARLQGSRLQGSHAWARDLKWALVFAGAAVTCLGLVQLVMPMTFLAPIDAVRSGVAHSSTFGYKNPAALFIVGQIFVLVGVALESRGWRRLMLTALLAVEVAYVVSLQSRTALLALLAGLVALALLPTRGERRWPPSANDTAVWALGAVLAIGAGFALSPTSLERAASRLSQLEPAAYLASDRGIYLRNTLAMVERQPLGVGLGDWQTEYPVFRRHGRDLFYDGLHQLRRAHSDHVQMLGELGWPGLALWLALLGSALWRGFMVRGRSPAAVAASAQFFAFTVAMAGDYVVEMPYHRLQFGLLLALLLIETGKPESRPAAPRSSTGKRPRAWLLAAACGVVWLGESTTAALTLRGAVAEVEVERTYRVALAVESTAEQGPALRPVRAAAERLDAWPFHTKTRFRADLIAAHAEYLLGDRRRACAHLRRSLEFYPYNPPAMQLAMELSREPAAKDAWSRAAHHVAREATASFGPEYPSPVCD